MATVTRHLAGSRLAWVRAGYTYNELVRVAQVAGADLAQAQYAGLLDANTPQASDSLVLGADPDDVTLFLVSRSVRNVVVESGAANPDVYLEAVWSNDPNAFPNGEAVGVAPEPDDDGDGTITVGAVVETRETELDVNGAEIIVQRTATSREIIQPVQFRDPRPVLEFSRWEVSSPRTRAETYVGKTNNAIWNGYAANTVLCTSIVGNSRDSGATYDVRYQFEYRPNGWTELVVYIDEDTGRPIANLVDGVSKVTVDLYDEADFSLLSITLS